MGYKIIIAEKKSVGTDIARVLGVTRKENGYFEGNGYIVSWAQGHLCGLKNADAYDPKYRKWSYEHLPIIPDKFLHTVLDGRKMQFDVLSNLMNRDDVDEVINACDAGREGELIFQNIYIMSGCKKPVKRLWISSMEDNAILEGFKNLKPGSDYMNLYLAASCREMADWLVGINFTRLLSLAYHRTLNVGRVVSPTLSLIVSREKERNEFKPENFYNVKLQCDDFTAVSDKITSRETAEIMKTECAGSSAVCESIESEIKEEKAPLLYDLTTLQKDANKKYGFTAQHTLDIAQSLYEKKLITYPRTDSRFLTDDMEEKSKEILKMSGNILGKECFTDNAKKLCNSSKVTDHYAIIPTLTSEKYDLSLLSEDELTLFRLINLNLLMAAAPKYVYESSVACIRCNRYLFTVKYISVIDYGWKKYMGKGGDEAPELDDILKVDKAYTVNSIDIAEGKTKPKPQYSEATLLSAMETAGIDDLPEDAERKGLGTPATRAGIIEKLISTGFVKRDKKNLIPEEVGINLVSVLPEDIRSPKLTAEWEQELKQVEKGKLSAEEFMSKIQKMVKNTCSCYRVSEDAKNLFPSSKEFIGLCPRCGGDVTESEKGFFCENVSCKFGLWKDNKFLTPRHINLDKGIAIALLNVGRIKLPQIVSLKSGRIYPGTLILDDDGVQSSYRIVL